MLIASIIAEDLEQQGIEKQLATTLAVDISTIALNFRDTKPGNLADAKSIIVFAHSFHQDELGNKTSGPVNKMLSELTMNYYERLQVPVFAQWEVGVLLLDRIPSGHLSIIYPKIDDSTGFQYLSTLDVINTAIDKYRMHPDDHSPTLIVCHKWHTVRCVRLIREDPRAIYHFDTITEQELMPCCWDSEAGLLWASDGLSHMISHIISSLADYRNQFILPKLEQKRKRK